MNDQDIIIKLQNQIKDLKQVNLQFEVICDEMVKQLTKKDKQINELTKLINRKTVIANILKQYE